MPTLAPTPDALDRAQLAEALMSAATVLGSGTDAPAVEPVGIPVLRGRLHLGRARRWLPPDGSVTVVVGFATAAWLGGPDDQVPDLGQLRYRGEARLDDRSRVVLDRQARAWLGVPDTAAFDVVVTPMASGGMLVVPVHDFVRRFQAVVP